MQITLSTGGMAWEPGLRARRGADDTATGVDRGGAETTDGLKPTDKTASSRDPGGAATAGSGSDQNAAGAKGAGSDRSASAAAGTDRGQGAGGKKGETDAAGRPLSADDKARVDALRDADTRVKAHERAHLAAAGGFARGGASYQYATGPDGRQYAVGGEVSVDTSPVSGDPEATIRKMATIQRAAQAPADPSPQDNAVAARAARAMASAQQQKASGKTQDAGTSATPADTKGSASSRAHGTTCACSQCKPPPGSYVDISA